MFADDDSRPKWRLELKIRAAMQDPRRARCQARAAISRLRPVWALAAGVAALGVGLSWLRLAVPPEPVFRGAEQRMGLEVELAGGRLNAHWATSAGASGYELQIYAADGTCVQSVEVATPTAKVELRGAELTGAAARPAFVEVVALDEFGQTLMRSQRVYLTDAPIDSRTVRWSPRRYWPRRWRARSPVRAQEAKALRAIRPMSCGNFSAAVNTRMPSNAPAANWPR